MTEHCIWFKDTDENQEGLSKEVEQGKKLWMKIPQYWEMNVKIKRKNPEMQISSSL